jgi:hypothetical protein
MITATSGDSDQACGTMTVTLRKKTEIAILLLVQILMWFSGPPGFAQTRNVSVYIEDNHGGSFYHLQRALDPDAHYRLVNIDAHPDLVAVNNYPLVRFMAGDPAMAERGFIQCYNWIHALTPRPVDAVTWIYSMTAAEQPAYDVRQVSRVVRESYQGVSIDMLPFDAWMKRGFDGEPVIVSVDLDFFCASRNPAADLATVLDGILSDPEIERLTVAVSRPYLPDDKFAFLMLQALFAELLTRTEIGEIRFEPYSRYPVDSSKRAQEYRRRDRAAAFRLGKGSGVISEHDGTQPLPHRGDDRF